MKKYKRIFMIVLDSLGAGAMLDAADYGDEGTDTFPAGKVRDDRDHIQPSFVGDRSDRG